MRELPINLINGDIVEIDGVEHVFERIDPDGRITFTSLRQRVEYMVTSRTTGFPIKPDADDVAALMLRGAFIKRAADLEEGARKLARKQELDAEAARATDPNSAFRVAFLRDYDANPCGLSDRALRVRNKALLENEDVSRLPGARLYAGSTLREWIHTRGHRGDRRARDGISMTGRMPRKRAIKHPKEILEHWVAAANAKRTTSSPGAKASALKAHQNYKGEINRINDGQPTGRVGAEYPQPKTPYKAISYSTFWRICRAAESSATLEAKHGKKAVYSRYGGGGKTERPTRLGALTMMDDTPIPVIFLVDKENAIPLGSATFHLMVECLSKVFLGWDLSWEEPSAATVLRTYAHANSPKAIPADLEALHPELKWLFLKPAVLLVDNLAGHHARAVEDSLLDVGTDLAFTGKEMPRDKAEMERAIGTILDLAFKDLPAATYDIPRAREFGFDPSTMTMIDIKQAREHLQRAICTYHLAPHAGLKGRQPALVFKQHAAKVGISLIDDFDEFKRSIGNVEYDVKLTPSGVVVNGLRYSDYQITRMLADDLVALQPVSEAKKTKKISIYVKVKYSPDDLGEVHVWNVRTKRYVTLRAADYEYANGMPLWAHKRVLDFARQEALEYSSEAELIEIRKRLFESLRALSPEASEQEKRTLAKLKDNPLFQRVMGDIVEIVDEHDCPMEPSEEVPPHVIPNELAASHRRDGNTATPRAAPAGASGRRAKPGQAPKRRDKRDAGVPKSKPSNSPVSRPSAGKNLKWGDQYD